MSAWQGAHVSRACRLQACVHVPDAAKAVAAAFQRFLDGCPESMMVEDERHQFCWRQVTVRTSVTRPQVMVLVLASSNGELMMSIEARCSHRPDLTR